ncbi:MAG: helix-hairpin-helix domain-containing protein, partial [Anaerolineae bacterium]|nr:helix-hairpin-helix domain-containing protein [Anaerolineae bacterium]
DELNAMRANAQALESERNTLRADVNTRDAELAKLRDELNAMRANAQTLEGERNTLRADVNTRDAELAKLRAEIEKLTTDATIANATIKSLEGERNTLRADAQARDAELAKLRDELNAARTQNQSLLADVAKFTAGAATAAATIQSLEGEREHLRVQISQLRGDLDAALRAHANLQTDLNARDAEIEKLRAQLHECQSQQATWRAQVEKLQSDLARATAELEARAQPVAPLATVEQIRARREDDETPYTVGCPQHLSDVKGIGSVYETRLYAAGVGTYWELSQLSDADLKQILQLTDLQAKQMDFRAIRAEARRLARQTKSLGRRWNGQMPDDFEPLEGIGKTYEKRLYDAGICTYEALANATVELLEEVCRAPKRFKPDYAKWIRQAKELAAKKAAGGRDVSQ